MLAPVQATGEHPSSFYNSLLHFFLSQVEKASAQEEDITAVMSAGHWARLRGWLPDKAQREGRQILQSAKITWAGGLPRVTQPVLTSSRNPKQQQVSHPGAHP